MKTDAGDVPLVAVGGGCFLVPAALRGRLRGRARAAPGGANAVGAAIAQVSGEADQIFQGLSRDEAIGEAERLARAKAVGGGADPATHRGRSRWRTFPIAYLPGNSLRVRVRVVGDVKSARRAALRDSSARSDGR